MEFFGFSHQGLIRTNNEDSFAIFENGLDTLPNLAIVADGMGGHQAGEVASQLAIDSFVEHIKAGGANTTDIMDLLNESLQHANTTVYAKSLSSPEFKGMGTTLTAAVISQDKIYVAHIGDSRLYIATETGINLITTDHTYVNEMVKAGILSIAEAMIHPSRNSLTKALGVGEKIEVDGYTHPFHPGAILLICSDGLTNMVSEEEIFNIIMQSDNLSLAAHALINRANENGGEDNSTVVLAKHQQRLPREVI